MRSCYAITGGCGPAGHRTPGCWRGTSPSRARPTCTRLPGTPSALWQASTSSTPSRPEWLHLSLATFGATTDVTDDCVRQAINAAHDHIAVLGSLELAFTRTVVLAESVVLCPDESPGLSGLRTALQESVRQVRGAGAPVEHGDFVPHVSVAYASGPAAGADVVTALESAAIPDVHPVHPTLTLAEMHRDGRLYRWRPVSAFPL